MKRIVSLVLSLVMLFSITSTMDFSAFAADQPIMAKSAALYAEGDSETESDSVMKADTWYYADVDTDGAAFKFVPEKTGYYWFSVQNNVQDEFFGGVFDENNTLLQRTVYDAYTSKHSARVKCTANKAYYFFIAASAAAGEANFYVANCDIANCNIKLSATSYTYDGTAKKPGVTVTLNGVTLTKDADYKVTYSNNTKAGTATVKISGINYFAGSVSKTFKINVKKLTKCTVKDVTYTGKALYPAVYDGSKKLVKGTDYTVSKISKNKNVGTASITIKFKGNYSGTITKSFKVLPKNVTGLKLTKRTASNISVSWKKVSGATGYKVYKWDTKKKKYVLFKTTKKTNCTVSGSAGKDVKIKVCAYKTVSKKDYISTGKEYTNITKPSKGKISKLTKPSKGRVNVYVSSKGYYEFQFSDTKKFKNYRSLSGYVENTKNEYFYIEKAGSGRTYFFRVRKYVYDKNGKKIYGAWSDVKSAKTK